MTHDYNELNEMHSAFLRALNNDPSPVSNLALLWHEALEMDRNPAAPSARTRGGAFLMYYTDMGSKPLAEVPGQKFEQDKLPHKTCSALISKKADSMDGPRSITFRYERGSDGFWTGGYSIETSQEYKDLVIGRQEIDARLSDALRAYWAPGVKHVGLVYGPPTWKDPVPMLKIKRENLEFIAADEPLMRIWDELAGYLNSHGHSHIYYADFVLNKPGAQLREGENVQLRYGR